LRARFPSPTLLLACFSSVWRNPMGYEGVRSSVDSTYLSQDLSELIFLNFHDDILMLGHHLGGKSEKREATNAWGLHVLAVSRPLRGADEVNPWAFCGGLTKIMGSPWPRAGPAPPSEKTPLSRIFWCEEALYTCHGEWPPGIAWIEYIRRYQIVQSTCIVQRQKLQNKFQGHHIAPLNWGSPQVGKEPRESSM
jgi:hypothetical protein